MPRAPSEDDYDRDDRNRAEGHGDRRRQKLANGVAYHARALRQEGFCVLEGIGDGLRYGRGEFQRARANKPRCPLGDRYGPDNGAQHS